MIAERIRVTPFVLEQVLACDIIKKINDHGRASVKGYIPPDREQEYMDMVSQGLAARIEAVGGNGESRVIFSGIVEEGRVRHMGGTLMMELDLVTHTYLMDLNPAIRAFQGPGLPYRRIFETIAGAYPGGACMMAEGEGTVAEDLVVQYEETDWEFLKRMASHLQTVMLPDFQAGGMKCYAGLPGWPGTASMDAVSYATCKLVGDYRYKKQNRVEGLEEGDELCYRVQGLEVLELGEQASFQGRVLCVAEAESHLDGHQLRSTYLLKPKAGFRVPKEYNGKAVGASLDGIVAGIEGAEVKVRLNADAAAGEGRWFPFSTVYSSPDGSGWYCMPEEGDEVRLYFPTFKEKHAYVVNAVHLPVEEAGAPVPASAGAEDAEPARAGGSGAPSGGQGTLGHEGTEGGALSGGQGVSGRAVTTGGGTAGTSAAGGTSGTSAAGGTSGGSGGGGMAGGSSGGRACRCDPDEKMILTSTGKMVMLNLTQILLSNGKGLEILLDDHTGITIRSNKKVHIVSQDRVDIVSASSIELVGTKSVRLKQKEGSITIGGSSVKLSGAEVRMQ